VQAPVVASSQTLAAAQLTLGAPQLAPIAAEALHRWESQGVNTAERADMNVRITNLGGTTLGLASGNTIWTEHNAARWGWFVDSTPHDDAEFSLPGNQGEQNRMDLLTVVMHELGHLLGHDHDEDGVMAEALAAGVGRTTWEHHNVSLADQVFRQRDDQQVDEWLGAWLSEQFDSMHSP